MSANLGYKAIHQIFQELAEKQGKELSYTTELQKLKSEARTLDLCKKLKRILTDVPAWEAVDPAKDVVILEGSIEDARTAVARVGTYYFYPTASDVLIETADGKYFSYVDYKEYPEHHIFTQELIALAETSAHHSKILVDIKAGSRHIKLFGFVGTSTKDNPKAAFVRRMLEVYPELESQIVSA